MKRSERGFFECRNEAMANELVEGCADSALMVSVHDTQGTYLSVSASALSFIGISPADLIGSSAYDHFHPEDFKQFSNRMRRSPSERMWK